MALVAQEDAVFTAELNGAETGLVGQLAVTVLRPPPDGTVVVERTIAGIYEILPPSGVYQKNDLIVTVPGDYLIVWDDGPGDGNTPRAGNQATETLTITETPPVPPPPTTLELATPSVDDVARHIMSRTKDKYGVEVGTFTADTRPHVDKVQEIINLAVDDVTTIIDTDFPESSVEYVREAIAIRAAMIIERSYYSDQVDTGRSVYEHLRDEWLRMIGTKEDPGSLVDAVAREEEESSGGEIAGPGSPSYDFPPADLRYEVGRPL